MLKTDAVSADLGDDFHPQTILSSVPVNTGNLLAPILRADLWTSFLYEGMGRAHPTKARLSLAVWTVQIWIVLVTVQNLYGSLVFRILKTKEPYKF